ncbi:MAG: SulP family inorganic anion transporter [Candidatus Kapabacteria bacterium]|nr:SulP family inorganic anion transporter [Candidatus Kapabacteria bacterium]
MSLRFSLPDTRSLPRDFSAALVVFLVALPLCLGIALASGAPLFAGIVAGVIGGLGLAWFSGSELSVSGPAAGLAVVVLSSINQLGSFEVFLSAVVLAGVLQMGISLLRAGTLGNYIPTSVIKGMLAAIGITIILKQIPHAVGFDRGFTDEEQAFAGRQWMDIFIDPVNAFSVLHPGAITVSVVSLIIILAWDSEPVKRMRWTGYTPAALIAVIIAALLNEVFQLAMPAFRLSAERGHLVELPVAADIASFFGYVTTPDFSAMWSPAVWSVALTIAAIASIETLLSIEAVDKMDPMKRISDANRELFAQGIGNALSGLFGGLPVTSVIVRSSANVFAGGRTRWSAILHSMLLLLAVLFIPTLLNRIPLAVLASVLLAVGYKLSSVKLIRAMLREGISQFVPFIVTTVMVVATDILLGVAIGILASIFFVMRANDHAAFTVVNDGKNHLIRFNKDVSFINKSRLKDILRSIPDDAFLIVDGAKALCIDHDVYEMIAEFEQAASFRNIHIEYHNYHGKERPWRKRRSHGIVSTTAT